MMQDVRYAFRTLKASPGFTAVAVLSLGLGIGANTAIFSLIDAVMLRSLPVERPQELMHVRVERSPLGGTALTNVMWEEFRRQQDVFSSVFAFGNIFPNLSSGGDRRIAPGMFASGDFFQTLGVRTVIGRAFTRDDDQRGCTGTAVLTYSFWVKEYGGDPGVLGKSISLDGRPFEVIGVAQRGFDGLQVGRPMSLILPLCSEKFLRGNSSQLEHFASFWLRIVGRPKPGLSQSQVSARLATLAPGIFAATTPPNWDASRKEVFRKSGLEVVPAAQGFSELRARYRAPLMILMGVVAAVLLIACANVANLLIARATARKKEIAIRVALGASRSRIVRQLFTESLLVAIMGAALGLAFAAWGAPLLVRLMSTTVTIVVLDLTPRWPIVGFTAAIALATSFLFGLAPAWGGSRVDPSSAMKAHGRGVVGRSRFSAGKFLVAGQVALSMVLLAGAGLLVETFRKLSNVDTGFDASQVLLVQVDLQRAPAAAANPSASFDQLLDRFRQLPGVRAATASNATPVSGSSITNTVQVEGGKALPERDATVYFNNVSPGYFNTRSIPIIAGRDFDSRDRVGSPPVAIINQAMAERFFGKANPIGARLKEADAPKAQPLEIIGVVANTKYLSLRESAEATAYTSYTQLNSSFHFRTFEVAAQGPPTGLIASIRRAVAELNPSIGVDFKTLTVQISDSMVRERALATLSGFFGVLALLLATIGLYGLMSQDVTRRRNEIGIRMALGAATALILRMVLREASLLIVAGIAIGVAGAVACTRLLEGFLFGMTARDPWTIGVSAAVLAFVALAAGYLPARRASRLDPMVTLREE